MDFAVLPPEINSARMYAGPGSGPMLAAAAAWDALAAELGSAATSYQSVLTDLTERWRGPAAMAMSTAAAPYLAWMNTTAAQAAQTATQAKAAAAAYESAFAMTVPPPVIAANRAQLAVLVATNFLGQNTPAIAATEAHYGEMWAQDAAAMYGYAGSAATATALTPFTLPKQNTNPDGLASQTTSVMQAAGTRAQTTVSQLITTVAQTLQGLSQPLQSTSATSGLGQMVMGGTAAASGKGAALGAGAGVAAGSSQGAGMTGVALDALGVGLDAVGLGPLEGGGLGIEFGGLGIELAGAGALPEGLGLGALGGLGLIGGLAPAAGLGGVSLIGGFGPLSGVGGVAGAGAAWASMGQAASLGSLSVPQTWTAAAPPAIRQVAMMALESSTAAAPVVAASASEIPYAQMALSGMAGRAMAGTVGLSRRDRAGATTRERPTPPQSSPESPVIGIVAELRGLAELRDAGILTDEEFTQQKQRLLGN